MLSPKCCGWSSLLFQATWCFSPQEAEGCLRWWWRLCLSIEKKSADVKKQTKQSPWNYLPDFKRYLVVNSFLVQNCLFAHLLGHHQQSSWDHTVQWRPSHCNFGWRKMKIYQQVVQNVQKQTNKQKPLKSSGVQEPVLLTLCYKCYLFIKEIKSNQPGWDPLSVSCGRCAASLGGVAIWNLECLRKLRKIKLFDYSDKYN